MSVVIITGSAGLIGSEATRYFVSKGLTVVGIDNNMRKTFFGDDASTAWNLQQLKKELGASYFHQEIDIRDRERIEKLFRSYKNEIKLVIHTAAQPSHDWAAKDPHMDFSVNALGTLNLLESTRNHCPESPFIFTSTNKVYGDNPNKLPLHETQTRWEIDSDHEYAKGIAENMSIDHCVHSLFGVSKVSADLMVQEYGKYFGLKTVCFRGGCLTGPNHSGTQLHGFLAYLVKCAMSDQPYTIFGYKGKQVRDNIHSADLIAAFAAFFENPRSAEVYNIGGGLESNCSMLEAIQITENLTGRKMQTSYQSENRVGDHIWYISDLSRFQSHYPDWKLKYDVNGILQEIYELNTERWV
ncbi:NAD-dependent epimerase/dehydratase family protein [Kiritimatiellota bacterium B12222]|nr:NAD-dependent epimerase/dehydratase family protein [Kiritimatiellota bacterium B12222]